MLISFHPAARKVNRYFHAMSSVCYSEKFAYYNAVNRGRFLTKQDVRSILSDWSIRDKKSMKEAARWLLDEGRRAEFRHIQNQLRFLSEKKRQAFIESVQDADLKYKMNVVTQYMNRLPSSTIAAMDFAFCVLLCTLAERVGFIGGVDALYLKTEAANKAQREYTSWPEYTAAFLAGIQFTKGTDEAFQESMKDKEAFIVKLLASDHSPLQKVSWNTDLFVLKERNENQ